MNKKKLIFFIFLCLVQIFEISAEDIKEKAFYAISSLRHCLEEKNSLDSDSDQIFFEEHEVTSLWEIARAEVSIQEELDPIRLDYDQGNYGSCELQLQILWESLQKDILSENTIATVNASEDFGTYLKADSYSNISKKIRKKIKPYLLPSNHRLKGVLDKIFSKSRAIANEVSFAKAGFITLFTQPGSFIRVAKHSLLPDHLVKVYLDTERRKKEGTPGWEWLVKRCIGAKNVRQLINKKKLQYFSVPDKWIYPLSAKPISALSPKNVQPIILLVTDMKLVSEEETAHAWRNQITTKHLDELFCILSHGYSSCYLVNNIPLSKSGKFTCIDTEHPKRKLDYQKVKRYLSPEMNAYWDKLVRNGG